VDFRCADAAAKQGTRQHGRDMLRKAPVRSTCIRLTTTKQEKPPKPGARESPPWPADERGPSAPARAAPFSIAPMQCCTRRRSMHAIPGEPATQACSVHRRQQQYQCSLWSSRKRTCTACIQRTQGHHLCFDELRRHLFGIPPATPRRSEQSTHCTTLECCVLTDVVCLLRCLQSRGSAPYKCQGCRRKVV